ncbi:MAG: hypothetical protein JRG90_00535, partial [Deltaproteobacteria bacterium]|nr:hypothetical protein [Deltaproteobacteria bacterium]
MRRLADLKLEKEYGILGGAEARALPAPNASLAASPSEPGEAGPAKPSAEFAESERAFERRAAALDEIAPSAAAGLVLPGGKVADETGSGPLE